MLGRSCRRCAMRSTWKRWIGTAIVLVGPATAAADPPELTPLIPPVVAVSPGPVAYYRPSRLDVWQHYAVDRTGHFRPRVALTPRGAYYTFSGEPYYWLPVQGQVIIPYLF